MTTNKAIAGITVGAGLLGVLLGGWTAGASGEGTMAAVSSVSRDMRPAIDRAAPVKTERAVFALG